jgi:hypothetical protein
VTELNIEQTQKQTQTYLNCRSRKSGAASCLTNNNAAVVHLLDVRLATDDKLENGGAVVEKSILGEVEHAMVAKFALEASHVLVREHVRFLGVVLLDLREMLEQGCPGVDVVPVDEGNLERATSGED